MNYYNIVKKTLKTLKVVQTWIHSIKVMYIYCILNAYYFSNLLFFVLFCLFFSVN